MRLQIYLSGIERAKVAEMLNNKITPRFHFLAITEGRFSQALRKSILFKS
jgi:hypothetical protein